MRTQNLTLRSVKDPSKVCTVHVTQSEADRVTVVVQDWANTGELCNASGVVGAYDCDGTYSVQYYRQSRIFEDRYPDGTGAINRKTEYRVGGVASRQQVNGQCGYSASRTINVFINDPSGILPNIQFDYANAYLGRDVDLYVGNNTFQLYYGDTLEYIDVSLYNAGSSNYRYVAELYRNGTFISSSADNIPHYNTADVQIDVDHNFDEGDASFELKFRPF